MDRLNFTLDNYGSNITEDVTLIQDLEEIGLTELETVVIACLATAVPLLIIFGLGLLIKMCIDRCVKRKAERYQGYLTRDDSRLRETEDEMKTSESQFSVIPPEEINEVVGAYGCAMAGAGVSSRPNGSIITINMKNNHLIVETEEPLPGISKSPTTLSPFSYATSTSSRNTLVSNTSGGTTYMVDIVEEQDTELDDLLDMNGPFMSNQEYYKYNKSKYEASQGGNRYHNAGASIHIADINTTCVDLTHHNHEPKQMDPSRKIALKDFQSDIYEQNIEDIFKRSLSDSVDNEEVLSVEILDTKNEALSYQKMLNDNQMFLKDIKPTHSTHHTARLTQPNTPQCNDCDSNYNVAPHYGQTAHDTSDKHNVQLCDYHPSNTSSTGNYTVNSDAHIRQENKVNTSPGIYDYACNCEVHHTEESEKRKINSCIPDVVQHNNAIFPTGPMSSQCILENYQNMYNDIRLGQVTSGFSQCDGLSCENEYYRYGNQTEYYLNENKSCKTVLPEEMVHFEQQKRLGNGFKTPSNY
uniref:Uncharacterized protein n=1 Tax=Cacopsylla melanoneura TaxID=428564 RepID=A0A8D8VZL7_9HEMI